MEARVNQHICIDAHFGLKQEALTVDAQVTQLFEKLRGSVYRYLLVLTANPAEAEEITQEAFLRLCRCLLAGRTISHVRSWIFRVAHNLAVDQNLSSRFLVPMEASAWQELCNFRPDPNLNPEQSILQHESFERFQSALKRLSRNQRECLILRAEGFRYDQIAEIIGTSAGNVAQLVRRGIKNMMEEIG